MLGTRGDGTRGKMFTQTQQHQRLMFGNEHRQSIANNNNRRSGNRPTRATNRFSIEDEVIPK